MKRKWTGERLETFVYNDATLEHLHRYAIAMDFAKDKLVLDIACGEGYGSNLLATVANQVTGIDIDQKVISDAKKKYQKENLLFSVGRLERIPVPASAYDLITCFETLEHLEDHDAALSEIVRVLKPGGIAIISTPDKEKFTDIPGFKNPFHVRELYREDLKKLLARYFRHHVIYDQQLVTSSLLHFNSTGNMRVYDGDYNSIQVRPALDGLYLVAICSSEEIMYPPSSVFISTGTIEKALDEKVAEIKSTPTYRLGHIILYPVKILRNLFKK